MPDYLAQVTFGHDSGLPEDVTVNTFHFTASGLVVDFDDIRAKLGTFYTATPVGGSTSLRARMSTQLSNVAEVRFYDLAAPKPRVPVHTGPLTGWTGPTAGAPLPSEVALVLSFQATPTSGVNQARRRNRIYLGPLVTGALGTGADEGRPAVTFIADARRAMADLKQASIAAPWEWVGYSPTDGVVFSITNGWVDNAFDTQRRRGLAPTARSEWT